MGASMRGFRLALTSLISVAGLGLVGPASGSGGGPRQEAKPSEKAQVIEKGKAAEKAKGSPGPAPGARPSTWRSEVAAFFSQPGDDPPRPSVPLRPATVEDRRRLEAIRLYTAARGLEDRGLWTDAVALLQEASKLDPDSVAIARRLSKMLYRRTGTSRAGHPVRPSRPGHASPAIPRPSPSWWTPT